MDNALFKTGLRFYQPANADAESIKDGFIIRKQEYDIVMDDIRRNGIRGSVQHYLLLGRRGSGKSTLLKRIQVEIETDKELSKKYIAINLAEEQANIYRLFDLLEEIIEELHHNSVETAEPLWNVDAQVFARNLFAAIHAAIEQSGKKLVLLLDNIDRIFENLHDDAALLREYLLNYDDIKIIGGSTRMTEHFWKYNKPFYEFFRVLELKPLSSIEIKELFLHWSIKLQLPVLKDFIEKKPGQLETIRILTDGLPRTLQFFINILINKTEATGYEYLKQIMDYITPLYQERLNGLPPAQRKIVLQMAFIWETTGTKELAEATRMDNKVISAQLKQLGEKGIAEKIETSNKNHLYRLSERFFNLWLIFTQGSPQEKRRAKYLTIFLENFYDGEELKKLAEGHLKCLEEGKMHPDKAAMLTKAYAQSRFISSQTRDELINKTLRLNGISEELKMQLPPDSSAIWNDIQMLIDKKQWVKAIKRAEEIEQSDGEKEFILGLIYDRWADQKNAEKLYLAAIAKSHAGAMNNIGVLYNKQQKFQLAEEYYQHSIGKGEDMATHNLALLYYQSNREKKKALRLLEEKPLGALYLLIKAWNGIFENLSEELILFVRSQIFEDLEITFLHLLIHHQKNIINKLFQSPEFGQELKDRFLPVYYATQILVAKDENIELKVPPELTGTVNDILEEIKEKQVFYYGNNE